MADTPKPPPNLRVATDEGKECDSCSHHKVMSCGVCMLDTGQGPICLNVNDDWVCDSYSKGSQQDDDADEPVKNVRDAGVRAMRGMRAERRSREASAQ